MVQVRSLLAPKPLFGIILLAVAVTGCSRKAPLYNVAPTPIAAASGQLTSAQVRSAIIKAANGRRWVVTEDNLGKIVLEISFGDHRATTTIEYSPSTYKMTYHDSENLGYDGSNIHKNYNKLIMRLQRQLIAELNDV